jgi:hypothetical protein
VVDLLSSFALRWVRIRLLPSMWYLSLFRSTTINDDSMILFYLCLLLFSVLFRVSFTKLLFPVLLILYGVADLSKTASLPS